MSPRIPTSLFSLALVHLILASLPRAAGQASLDPRQGEEKDLYSRRAFHGVAVLGDYLYIEGGEVTAAPNSDSASIPVNNTISIRLNEDWSNDTVVLNEIEPPDGKPPWELFGLWPDEDSQSLYRWAGERAMRTPVDADYENTLWVFNATENGGGQWSKSAPDDPVEFSKINMASYGAAASCDGMGYYLGGASNKKTQARFTENNNNPLPGMLLYNMTSRHWANESSVAMSPPIGTHRMGEGLCLEGWGEDSLIMILGGSTPSLTEIDDYTQNSLTNITFYDPKRNQWFWQRTNDDNYPPSRDNFCMVGAQGKNGTYEIYIYGGSNTQTADLDDVWVLTLPGFEWFQTGVKGSPRRQHSCALAGKRQMISVGGVESKKLFGTPDPWAKGIGVLDLPTLEWKTKYEANAGDYDSPQFIKDWYEKGGLDKVNWSSEEMKEAFYNGRTGSDQSGLQPAPQSHSSNTSPNGLPVGAIAGAIVGGVVLLVLAPTIAWVLYYRSRRAKHIQATAESRQIYELDDSIAEMDDGRPSYFRDSIAKSIRTPPPAELPD